jgi:hypothetical protein
MTWTCGQQRIRIWQGPFLGVLLVVSFLSHDLLMAAEAVAAPLPSGGRAHHRIDLSAARADMPAWQSHSSTPEHPENCRIGQSAVAQSADSFARGSHDLAISVAFVGRFVSASGDDGAFLWEEPHWPPGTLRALFQVYRI